METLVDTLRARDLAAPRSCPGPSGRCRSCSRAAPRKPKGFRELFERTLRARPFPIEVAEVRMATDPLTATARGALIAAMYEK